MTGTYIVTVIGLAGAIYLAVLLYKRLLLSRAKHPSLTGHVRLAKLMARLVPYYEYDETGFFRSDRAPDSIAAQRRSGFERLSSELEEKNPRSIQAGERIEPLVSDVQFVNRYRVPFQYSRYVREHLKPAWFVMESAGVTVTDLDGNQFHDVAGSYGVNLLGNDFYKNCLEAGFSKVAKLGPVLGPYHPIVEDNARSLRELSGLDEISFHMSGTEAVMQAVRLALYHTGRRRIVRFCGAYHGWWDGVQPGIGNPRGTLDVYTLRDMDDRSLRVLRSRRDIACVIVNPLQAMHPNSNAPGDGALIDSGRLAALDTDAYREWLQTLRRVCTERGVVLILDDIFAGFRLAYGGSQEYFGFQADIVTYGKTLGGGLPVGVVCGRADLMKRYRENRPADICFARGTFNAHPYVMATMNEFIHRSKKPEIRALYNNLDATWNERARLFNQRLESEALPVKVANLSSIFTVLYTRPSRYNWMLQFYLSAEGLLLGWIGTGRLIFSLDYSDEAFREVIERFVRAARRMHDDGWWWHDGLTNKSIRKQVLREMLGQRLNRSPSPVYTIAGQAAPRPGESNNG